MADYASAYHAVAAAIGGKRRGRKPEAGDQRSECGGQESASSWFRLALCQRALPGQRMALLKYRFRIFGR